MKIASSLGSVVVAAVIAFPSLIASVGGHPTPSTAQSVLSQNKVPGTVESTARRLMNSLRHQGYEVARGYLKLYTMDDCPRSYAVMRTCFGNNPAAPYVLPVVPPWPEEWVDPATIGAFGDTADGYNGSYRLDPREAIVILGVLPPPAAYFGIQTYLFTRPAMVNENSTQYKALAMNAPYMLETFFGRVPGNQARLQLMANISDSNNNVVMANRSGVAWDQLRYFVITPDQAMDRAMRAAFAAVGVADEFIFTERIPSALGTHPSLALKLGLDPDADDFFTAIRYAMPQDGGSAGTPSDRWRRRLPLVVLRIRAAGPVPEPYPPLALAARTPTTPPEISLKADLSTLVKAVCRRWDQPCDVSDAELAQRAPEFLNMQVFPFLVTGPECLPIGMNCLAPTEDTTYFLSGKLPLDDQTVYAVVGAVGTLTDNATYVGLGLNSSLYKLAFDNLSDEDLSGTAADYEAVPNHDRFFVQYFARDCSALEELTGNSHCYSIGDSLPRCMDKSDLTCEMLVLSLRGYIRPTTERGTSPQFALSPRFLKLDRR
jgi:hypothetical protein